MVAGAGVGPLCLSFVWEVGSWATTGLWGGLNVMLVQGAVALVCLYSWEGGVGGVCQDGKGPVIGSGTRISNPRLLEIWGHMVYEGTVTYTRA